MPSTIAAINRSWAHSTGILRSSRVWTAMVAAVLGASVIYLAGFTEVAQVHNAAHDARHTAGFPCH